MTLLITALFALTYAGMALGRIPGSRVDRTGIAMIVAVSERISHLYVGA